VSSEIQIVKQRNTSAVSMNTKSLRKIKHSHSMGKKITRRFQLTVPVGAGMKSSLVPSQTSKGLGGDRALRRQLESLGLSVKPKSKHGEQKQRNMEDMQSDLAETNLAL
jgi:hypothetical protein